MFVFGGPGSRKGTIVDNMICEYGFRCVGVSDLFRTAFPKFSLTDKGGCLNILNKMDADTITNAMITLIKSDLNAVYIFDIIPNLKILLKSRYLRSNCEGMIDALNSKFPVSVAIHLKANELFGIADTFSTFDSRQVFEQQDSDSYQLPVLDEIDNYKKLRRIDGFVDAAYYFIKGFSSRRLLATIDVTRRTTTTDIWRTVRKILGDLDFQPIQATSTVILFEFEENDLIDVDYEKYVIDRVVLCDVAKTPDATPMELMVTLRSYISKHAGYTESFAVKLNGTSITRDIVAPPELVKQPITFRDVMFGYLEDYLPGRPAYYAIDPNSTLLKVVGSSESEVCLFPDDVSDLTCQTIASMFLQTANRLT